MVNLNIGTFNVESFYLKIYIYLPNLTEILILFHFCSVFPAENKYYGLNFDEIYLLEDFCNRIEQFNDMPIVCGGDWNLINTFISPI
jgi:hypothetical protein